MQNGEKRTRIIPRRTQQNYNQTKEPYIKHQIHILRDRNQKVFRILLRNSKLDCCIAAINIQKNVVSRPKILDKKFSIKKAIKFLNKVTPPHYQHD